MKCLDYFFYKKVIGSWVLIVCFTFIGCDRGKPETSDTRLPTPKPIVNDDFTLLSSSEGKITKILLTYSDDRKTHIISIMQQFQKDVDFVLYASSALDFRWDIEGVLADIIQKEQSTAALPKDSCTIQNSVFANSILVAVKKSVMDTIPLLNDLFINPLNLPIEEQNFPDIPLNLPLINFEETLKQLQIEYIPPDTQVPISILDKQDLIINSSKFQFHKYQVNPSKLLPKKLPSDTLFQHGQVHSSGSLLDQQTFSLSDWNNQLR